MARVKYYDKQSEQWKYADAAFGANKDELIQTIEEQGVLTYKEQELTEEQKAQARENIGIDQISFDKLNEDLDANGYRIVGLSEPQQSSEPATKGYVDTFVIEANTFVATDDGEGNVTIVPYENDVAEPIFMEHIGNKQNPHAVTAEQIGAATTAEVNAAVKKAAPRSLLDNSDFTNPVNQRGNIIYGGGEFSIDRWRSIHSVTTHTLFDNGLKISGTETKSHSLITALDNPSIYIGKMVTLCMYISENNTEAELQLAIWMGKDSGSQSVATPINKIIPAGTTGPVVVSGVIPDLGSYACFSVGTRIRNGIGSFTVKWIALYEGEYTLDTLPDYQPKGYNAELTECMRYYQHYSNKGNYQLPIAYGRASSTTAARVTMPISISMRTTPDIEPNENLEFYLLCNGNNIGGVTVEVIDMKNNLVILDVIGTEFTKDQPVVLAYRGALSTTKTYFALNAEL